MGDPHGSRASHQARRVVGCERRLRVKAGNALELYKPARGSAAQLDPHGHFRPVVRDRTDAAMSDPIVLKVAMMCAGCSGAVERVLKKMEGAISSPADVPDEPNRSASTPRRGRAASGRHGRRRGDPVSAPHHPRAPLRGLGHPRLPSRLHLTDRLTPSFPTTSAPCPLARVRAPPFPQASSLST